MLAAKLFTAALPAFALAILSCEEALLTFMWLDAASQQIAALQRRTRAKPGKRRRGQKKEVRTPNPAFGTNNHPYLCAKPIASISRCLSCPLSIGPVSLRCEVRC